MKHRIMFNKTVLLLLYNIYRCEYWFVNLFCTSQCRADRQVTVGVHMGEAPAEGLRADLGHPDHHLCMYDEYRYFR